MHAQTYVKKFYQPHGFKRIGDEFMEAGIPHVKMIRRIKAPFRDEDAS
ncbi:MAG: GNAT family N-acetyltransferase [Pyrinomonadaceae bacterium]